MAAAPRAQYLYKTNAVRLGGVALRGAPCFSFWLVLARCWLVLPRRGLVFGLFGLDCVGSLRLVLGSFGRLKRDGLCFFFGLLAGLFK